MAEYEVRVNGRLYEISKSEERKDEIVGILAQVCPEAEISTKKIKSLRK